VYHAIGASRIPADSADPNRLWPLTMVVRYDGDETAAAQIIRDEMRALDRRIPVFAVTPLDQIVARSVASTSFALLMIALAGGVTLTIGAVGLYGVIAYTVALRTREIGVRIALGAAPRAVGRLVVREGVGLAVIGIAFGVVLFLAVAPVLRHLLFQVAPRDPASVVGVAVGLFAVSVAASGVPAWRASRVDPTEALRAD
jgi:putative ABC transport system permease protein